MLCAGLHALFDGKADVVDLVFENYYGACGWGTVRLDAEIQCVQYGPAGDVMAAGGHDKHIHFICAQTGEKILCPLRVDSMVMSLSYAPSGDMLAVGDYDGNIHFFNAKGEKALSPERGHSNVVGSVCFSSDGKKLTSGSADATARNWNPATRASLS